MQVSAVSAGYGYGNAMGVSSMQGTKGPPPPRLAGKQLSDLDTDGDGSISQSELLNFLSPQDASTSSTAAQRAADLLKKIDTDGDGKISASEWGAFQQKVGHHHHQHSEQTQDSQQTSTKLQDLVNQVYKGADANADGQLTQDELGNWLQKALSGSQVNVAF
jgi:Ca2+-binding EF-hand superfamily protein